MNKNDGEKMIREMREMIRARNKSVRELEPYQAGMYFLVNEDFERSAASFQLAIKQNPHFAFSHYYLGRSLRRLGKTIALSGTSRTSFCGRCSLRKIIGFS